MTDNSSRMTKEALWGDYAKLHYILVCTSWVQENHHPLCVDMENPKEAMNDQNCIVIIWKQIEIDQYDYNIDKI